MNNMANYESIGLTMSPEEILPALLQQVTILVAEHRVHAELTMQILANLEKREINEITEPFFTMVEKHHKTIWKDLALQKQPDVADDNNISSTTIGRKIHIRQIL